MPLTDKATIVDTNVVIQAAIAGQGMALGIFPFCQSEVDSGRLIKPFDIDLTPTRSFHLLTRPGARQRREIDEGLQVDDQRGCLKRLKWTVVRTGQSDAPLVCHLSDTSTTLHRF
jgi:hypothetical protein